MKQFLRNIKNHINSDPMGKMLLSFVKSRIKLTLQKHGVIVTRVKKPTIYNEPKPYNVNPHPEQEILFEEATTPLPYEAEYEQLHLQPHPNKVLLNKHDYANMSSTDTKGH